MPETRSPYPNAIPTDALLCVLIPDSQVEAFISLPMNSSQRKEKVLYAKNQFRFEKNCKLKELDIFRSYKGEQDERTN